MKIQIIFDSGFCAWAVAIQYMAFYFLNLLLNFVPTIANHFYCKRVSCVLFFPLFLTLFGCIDAIYCQPLIFLDFIPTSIHLLQRIKWKKKSQRPTVPDLYGTWLHSSAPRNCAVFMCEFKAQMVLFTYASFKLEAKQFICSAMFFSFRKRHQTDQESFISQRFFPFQHLVDFNANYHNQRIDAIFFSLFNIGLLGLCLLLL